MRRGYHPPRALTRAALYRRSTATRPTHQTRRKDALHPHNRPLKLLALAVTFAALAVPTAHGDIPPAVKYGPLDPSVYNVVHPSVQSAPFITEHSAGQNGTR
jgi:hypothetical protein